MLVYRQPNEDDFLPVQELMVQWWGDIGGEMATVIRSALLPRLFFQHFVDTSFIVEDDGRLVAFLIGFLSQSHDDQAYIHFVGVDPSHRGNGLGRDLYERFFEIARENARSHVHAITGPANVASQNFHRAMGFSVSETKPNYDGFQYGDRITFCRDVQTRGHEGANSASR